MRYVNQNPGHSRESVKSLVIADKNESRPLLEEMFGLVEKELKNIKRSTLEIVHDGYVHRIIFRFSFSADMKFLYLALGQKGANSKFSCFFCTCPDTLRAVGFTLDPAYVRSFADMCAKCPHCNNESKEPCPDKTHGVKAWPNLLKDIVELEDIVVDLLHMKLRLSDRLEMHMQTLAATYNTEMELAEAAKSIGLSYRPYKNKKTKKTEWPSLPCDLKMRLMQSIDPSTFIPVEEEAAKVKILLANFVTLVDFLSCHCQLGHHDSCEHTLKTLDDFISHVGTMSTNCRWPKMNILT